MSVAREFQTVGAAQRKARSAISIKLLNKQILFHHQITAVEYWNYSCCIAIMCVYKKFLTATIFLIAINSLML